MDTESTSAAPSPFSQTFFHDTKADLKIGDLIELVFLLILEKNSRVKYVNFTATLDAAIWEG